MASRIFSSLYRDDDVGTQYTILLHWFVFIDSQIQHGYRYNADIGLDTIQYCNHRSIDTIQI